MNNDTTVNVNIGATDSSRETVQNAADNFSNLWKQVASGQIAASLAQKGFDIIVGSIGNAITTAGNFQAQLTQLVTGAGESQKNLKTVGDGIKQIAVDTGSTLDQLTQGMYLIESAGFHGADGLNVLKIAAEGAKADGADLQTVANALTTVLHDYNIPASQAAQVTNQMVAAVAQGKMHMQDFASSLSTVLPLAHQVGLSFAEVAGGEATLTAGGVDAAQATQDLAALIRTLQVPTLQQTQMMQAMGLSSLNLSEYLGKRGLTGTLLTISDAILNHMGPDGLVIQSTLKNAKVAAADANQEIQAMPKSLQAMAKGFLDGNVTAKEWRKELQALPPLQQHMMQQFATTANGVNSFNKLLTSGQPAAQTYANALKTLTGQSNAANAAMLLTGGNFLTFQGNVQKIAAAGKEAGKNIGDWALIQGTFNQKLAEMKERLQVVLESLGERLLPILSSLMDHYKSIMQVAGILAPIAGGILLVVGAMKAWEMGVQAVEKAQIALDAIMAMNPIILAAMAIIAVALLIITHWSLVKQWFGDFITWLKGHWELLVDILFGPIGIAVTMIIDHWKTVKSALEDVWNAIKSMFDTLKGIVGKVLDGIGDALHQFTTHFWQDIGFAIGFMIGMPIKIIEAFVTLEIKLTEIFLNAGRKAIDAFGALLTWIIHINWGDVFKGIGNAVLDVGKDIVSKFTGAWTGSANSFKAINWGNIFKSIKDSVLDAVKGAGHWLYDAGKAIVDGLVNGVKGAIKNAVRAIKDLGKGIEQGFRDAIGWHSPSLLFTEAGQSIGQGLINGMQSMQVKANLATTQLVSGSPAVGSASSPASNSTSNYNSYGGNRSTVTIQQLVLSSPAAVQEFFKSVNQDTLNVGKGLTAVQGAY